MAAQPGKLIDKAAGVLRNLGIVWLLLTFVIVAINLGQEGAQDGAPDFGRVFDTGVSLLPVALPGLFLIWLGGRLRRMNVRRIEALTGVARMLAQRASVAAERGDPASRRGALSHGTPSEIVMSSDTPTVSNVRSRTRRSVIQR